MKTILNLPSLKLKLSTDSCTYQTSKPNPTYKFSVDQIWLWYQQFLQIIWLFKYMNHFLTQNSYLNFPWLDLFIHTDINNQILAILNLHIKRTLCRPRYPILGQVPINQLAKHDHQKIHQASQKILHHGWAQVHHLPREKMNQLHI